MTTTIWVRDTNGNSLGSMEIEPEHKSIDWNGVWATTTPNGIVLTINVNEEEEA